MAAVTLAVYWPGLSGGFLFDDYPNLVDDNDWRMSSLAMSQVLRALGEGIASGFGRGLAMLSFGLNYLASGLDPWPMKLTNVLMHVVAGLLALALTRRLFVRLSPRAPGGLGASVVGAAWLIHPLQASTVLYVVQRMEVGAGVGVFGALLCYVIARERQLDGGRASTWLSSALGFTALGVGFKETAALTPAFALLLELFVFRFAMPAEHQKTRLRAIYVAGVCVAIVLYATIILPRYLQASAYAGRPFDLAERLLTQPRVLTTYLGQILLPLPSTMPFYYDGLTVSTAWLRPLTTLFSTLAIFALLGACGWLRQRRPLFALGIAWFFMAHVLTSNVVPLELAFEHRNYVALLGVLWAVADMLSEATRRLSQGARRTLAVIPIVALAALCAMQTMTWGNPVRLDVELESRAPASPRAAYALATRFYRLSGGDASSPAWSMAIAEFRHAAALPDSSILGDQAVIVAMARAHRPVTRADWDALRHKLTYQVTRPEDVGALYSLVQCGVDVQCGIDRKELGTTLHIVLRRNPDDPDLRIIMSNYLLNIARDAAEALAQARMAVRLAPSQPRYRVALAEILLASDLHNTREIQALIAGLRAENRHGELDPALAEISRLETQLQSRAEPAAHHE
ncbi:MAG: tetratricopeptide repeat protein [Paraburkholderia graminis]|uniref:tetratricopeptide repeat protein n=1 Tax=Paraburkholderia graminis TaxID=60548 RepID=UPI00389A39E7